MEKVIIKIINYTNNIDILGEIKNTDIRKNVLESYIKYKSQNDYNKLEKKKLKKKLHTISFL